LIIILENFKNCTTKQAAIKLYIYYAIKFLNSGAKKFELEKIYINKIKSF